MAEKISDTFYPKWKYHATEKPRIVNSASEEKFLGAGWENSPAYFEKKKEASPIEADSSEVKRKKSFKETMWQLLGI